MNESKRADYITRDAVLKLLSAAEIAAVSAAEDTARLSEGEEYLDLEHLDRGVKRAKGANVRMATVLPKRALERNTWQKILGLLATQQPGSDVPIPG